MPLKHKIGEYARVTGDRGPNPHGNDIGTIIKVVAISVKYKDDHYPRYRDDDSPNPGDGLHYYEENLDFDDLEVYALTIKDKDTTHV